MQQYLFLSHPDDWIVDQALQQFPDMDQNEIEALMVDVKRRREEHPFFVDHLGEKHSTEIVHSTTGTCFDLAFYTAQLSGSHLATDLGYRWKELQIHRNDTGVDVGLWQGFTKAFQGTQIRCLNNVPLEAAHKLRKEQRLF